MCNCITGIEYLNDRHDPFGFKLKGWADQVKINKDDFDEVFGELLEKYKGNGKKLEPELKLAMMLVISAGSFHMTQSMTSTIPGLDDVIKNNPQLVAKLQSNINKSISGPSELDKKKELYENVKKLHTEKVKSNQQMQQPQSQSQPQPQSKSNPQSNPQSQPKSNQQQSNPQSNPQSQQRPNINTSTLKPTSVKNLLNDIKNSMPTNSNLDSNSITLGDTINSDSETTNRPSISTSIKTKSRLANKKNIQFSNA